MLTKLDRIPQERVLAGWRLALQRGYGQHPAVLFHDLDWLGERLGALRQAFPPGTLHSLAIKSNPVIEILRHAVSLGSGLECASWEEVALARAAGCPPENILFDSPAKTEAELEQALALGIRVNADNFVELERIAALLDKNPTRSKLGLRINPQVGGGSIAITSVATRGSRFGVPFEAKDAIVAAFRRYPWLSTLHYHVGSQGCELDLFFEAARRVEALRTEIGSQVKTIDLGGGLSAHYREGDPVHYPGPYAEQLRTIVPEWFAGAVELVTEFGRWVQASCGFAVSRIEYVKDTAEGRVLVLHLGADLMLRRVYQPDSWHHDFVVLDPQGNPRGGETVPSTVTGPLCFAGDVLGRDLPLAQARPGDFLLIRDVGAYCISLWTRHCSRSIPEILGLKGDDLVVLRRRETPEDLVKLWSRGA